jgi:MYXO-CTERM domain-containing protein
MRLVASVQIPVFAAAALFAARSLSSPRPATGGAADAGVVDAGAVSDAAADAATLCDDGGACALPPPPPTATTPAGTAAQNFALHHVHLGDEPGTCADGLSWCQYGYNLDGKDTTSTSTNVCTLYAGASTLSQVDGPGGVDNSFGANVINGLIAAVISNPSQTESSSLTSGAFTFMFDVTGLTPGAGQSSTGLQGMLFGGVAFAQGPNSGSALPTFTTADDWPVDPSYVTSAISSCTTLVPPVTSSVTLSGAYVAGGVFVSGEPLDVTLKVQLEGFTLVLPLRHAMITFNHPGALDAGTADTHVSGGIIAGVVDAQELVSSIDALTGYFGICSGSTFTEVNDAILGAADIMDDGSNQPGVPCNGISVGIGFDADEIAQPQVAGAPLVVYNPCDGGSSSGSGGSSCGGDSGTDSGSADDGGSEASSGSSSGGEAGAGSGSGSSSGGSAGGAVDAAAPSDAGTGGAPPQTSNGCSCNAAGAPGSPGGLAFAALALAMAARKRKRS